MSVAKHAPRALDVTAEIDAVLRAAVRHAPVSVDLLDMLAAAPELLAACESMLAGSEYLTPAGTTNCRFCHEGTFRDQHADDCLVRGARAAIAKARGGR